MGYFPNSTAWEFWAADNCFKCRHWPQSDDDPACAVEMAHMLHNYDQGDDGEDCAVRSILSMLIPRSGIENERCAMFADRDGLTEKHLRDWQKYKAIMAERDGAQTPEIPTGHSPQ